MRIPLRYKLVASTFSLTLLLYMDRVGISAAKSVIGGDLSLSDTEMGWVMSAFALGYALFQVPSGILVDRLGARKVITVIVSAWSFFTLLTGAAWNYTSMLIVRFLFGGGEAGAFPSISRANLSWIPLQERGTVTGINFSGSRLGAAFAFPIVTWMITYFGWRVGFLVMGGAGLIWAIFWYKWFRDNPEEHSAISDEERDYINANRQKVSTSESPKISARKLLGSGQMWLAMGQYFSSNFIFFFCLTWMFPYLRERFGIDAQEASIYAMFPLICGAIGNWSSGWLVDRIFRNDNWRWSRAIPAIIGFVLVGIGILFILYTENIVFAVISLCIAVFGADMTLSPSWSYCVDVGKKNAGAVSGAMNTAGNVGSFLTSIIFPYLIVWTGTSDTFFIISLVFVVLAITMWMFMDPTKPIIDEEV